MIDKMERPIHPLRRADDSDPQLSGPCRYHDQAFNYLGDLHAEKFKSLENLVETKFAILAERIVPVPDSLQRACLDICWVKRIGYVLVIFCISLAATGWSLVVPFAANINSRLAASEAMIQVHIQKLSTLEANDMESKIDRKAIHDEQMTHRRSHVAPVYGNDPQGKR